MSERPELDLDEATLRAVEETRAFIDARPAPDFTAGVVGRIGELAMPPARPGALRRLFDWIWTPRHVDVRWRPAYGLVAAAVVFLLIIFLPYGWRRPAGQPLSLTSASNTDPHVFVQFRLEAADAMDVRLAGSFTNWQPRYSLHQASPGVWTITVPLSAGVHDYVFVVDGQRWVADPYAPHVDDGFGGVNSRIALVPPDAPRL
jgi:AMP-activated protein kinase-like protein